MIENNFNAETVEEIWTGKGCVTLSPFHIWHCKQTLNHRNNTKSANKIIKQIDWHHYLKGVNLLDTHRYWKYCEILKYIEEYWKILKYSNILKSINLTGYIHCGLKLVFIVLHPLLVICFLLLSHFSYWW